MLIIQVIASGIIFFGIDATWSTFVTGAVIIVAVVLDQTVKHQRMRSAASPGRKMIPTRSRAPRTLLCHDHS